MGKNRQLTMFGLPPEPDDEELDQFFTPPPIAQTFVNWSRWWESQTIIEPSAGGGALLEPMLDVKSSSRHHFIAVELDNDFAEILERSYAHDMNVEIIHGDYLETKIDKADLWLGNPPYSNRRDERFVEKGLQEADRVCALLQTRFIHSKQRWETIWSQAHLTRIGHFALRAFPGAIYDYSMFEFRRGKTVSGCAFPVETSWHYVELEE